MSDSPTPGTYTGHVDAGGPPARRTVTTADGEEIEITKLSVGSMDNNAYLLHAPATGESILIDAADEADRILGVVGERRVGALVTTHRHNDHWRALAAVAVATGAPTLAGEADAGAIDYPIDRTLAHGDEVSAGPITLHVLHTPGHTPGSVCLLLETSGSPSGHLFTGDTLFPGGPGRTTSPDDFAQIMSSVERRLFDALPDETWVYPGHGDDTTLGAERPKLPEWRARGW